MQKVRYFQNPALKWILAAAVLICLAWVVYFRLKSVSRPPNEFWISNGAHSHNLGTREDPFICTNEMEFDSTMRKLPPNCTIHIGSGIYMTEGSIEGFAVKTGQKIVGSGMDATTLRLAPKSPDGSSVIGSSFGTNMLVADMTCDGNYQAQNGAAVTYCGATLFGTRNAIKRVKVINLAKFGGNSEAWGIVLNRNNIGESTGNIIEDCEVTEFQGGSKGQGISAFSLNGGFTNPISGIVRSNRVLLSPNLSHPVAAFNHNCVVDSLYEGNLADGATYGFYGDTGWATNVIVRHNTFKNVVQGVTMSNIERENMTFSQNNIMLSTNKAFLTIAFNIHDTWVDDIRIIGNRVSWNAEPPKGYTGYFLCLNEIDGLVVSNNTVDSRLPNELVDSRSYKRYLLTNNYDLKGNPYPVNIGTHP